MNSKEKNRKIWARIGISALVTEEEYKKFKEQVMSGYVELTNEEAEWFMKNGHADGDCYLSANDYIDDEERVLKNPKS